MTSHSNSIPNIVHADAAPDGKSGLSVAGWEKSWRTIVVPLSARCGSATGYSS